MLVECQYEYSVMVKKEDYGIVSCFNQLVDSI